MLLLVIICILCTLTVLIITIYGLSLKIKNSLIELSTIEQDKQKINKEVYDLNINKNTLINNLEVLKQSEESIKNSIKNQEEMSDRAFYAYYNMLERRYDEAEEEHNLEINSLQDAYSNLQFKLMQETDECRKELDKLRATRAAAIQAQIKENEISEKSTFYCLTIPELELKDITILETIKPKLNNPRVLSMLIWQTYYRTPMTDLCNRVVGKNVKTGIYKITNQLTSECYIGQAVDIASRWKDHAKCGLGIDTPAKNKLYKAMIEYGLSHFSWEILEECERENLDEKEKFFINLYQAKEYGYNSTSGNN